MLLAVRAGPWCCTYKGTPSSVQPGEGKSRGKHAAEEQTAWAAFVTPEHDHTRTYGMNMIRPVSVVLGDIGHGGTEYLDYNGQ